MRASGKYSNRSRRRLEHWARLIQHVVERTGSMRPVNTPLSVEERRHHEHILAAADAFTGASGGPIPLAPSPWLTRRALREQELNAAEIRHHSAAFVTLAVGGALLCGGGLLDPATVGRAWMFLIFAIVLWAAATALKRGGVWAMLLVVLLLLLPFANPREASGPARLVISSVTATAGSSHPGVAVAVGGVAAFYIGVRIAIPPPPYRRGADAYAWAGPLGLAWWTIAAGVAGVVGAAAWVPLCACFGVVAAATMFATLVPVRRRRSG